MNTVMAILSIIFGSLFLIFHSYLKDEAIESWRIRYPKVKIWDKGYDILFIGVGIVFIVFGILELFGLIQMHK